MLKKIRRKERFISLMALWSVGAVMLLYLGYNIFSNRQGTAITDLNKRYSPSDDKQNEAYVFVTIDKKHFLTRFTSFISDDDIKKESENIAMGKNENRMITPVKKILRRSAAKPSKAPEDFSIKPVPQ